MKGVMLEDLVVKDRPHINSSLHLITRLLSICCKTNDEVCVPHFDTQLTHLIRKGLVVDNEIGNHKLKRALYEMIDRLGSMNLSISFGCCEDLMITNIILGKLATMDPEKIPTDHMRIAVDRDSLDKQLATALGDCVVDRLSGFPPGSMSPNIMDGHVKIIPMERETTKMNAPFITTNSDIIFILDINEYLRRTARKSEIRIPEFFLAIRRIIDDISHQLGDTQKFRINIPEIDVQLQKVYYQHIDTMKDLLKEKFNIYKFLPETRTGEEIDVFFRNYAIEDANYYLKNELLLFLNASNENLMYDFGRCGDTEVRDAFANTFDYMQRHGRSTQANIVYTGEGIEFGDAAPNVDTDKGLAPSSNEARLAADLNGEKVYVAVDRDEIIAGWILLDFMPRFRIIMDDETDLAKMEDDLIRQIQPAIAQIKSHINFSSQPIPRSPLVMVGWVGLEDFVDQVGEELRDKLKEAGYTTLRSRHQWKEELLGRLRLTLKTLFVNCAKDNNLRAQIFVEN